MSRLWFAVILWLILSVRNLSAFPQPEDYWIQIAVRPDGMHAMPYWYYKDPAHSDYTFVPAVWVWSTNSQTGREVVVQKGEYNKWNWPNIQFIDTNRFCTVDNGSYQTNIGTVTHPTNIIASSGEVSTFDLTSGQRLDFFRFSNGLSRWGDSCRLKSGGLFFINYDQASGPNGEILCWVNYRLPPVPPDPVGTNVIWKTYHYTTNFVPFAGVISSSNWGVVEFNGMIWVFVIRDSSQMLAFMRFKETNSGIEVVDWHPDYISGFSTNGIYDPMTIDGELPDLSVRSDPDHNRIIATYQCWADWMWACSSRYTHVMIAGINPDLSRYIVTQTTNWTERVIGLACWARPDAAYFTSENSTLETNCFAPYIFGSSTKNVIRTLNDKMEAICTSPDGWFAHQGTNGFVIENMFAGLSPAKLRISKSDMLTREQVMAMAAKFESNAALSVIPAPANAKVEWDNLQPGDLQQTRDLTNWTTAISNAPNPSIVPMTNSPNFFRLIQTP